MQLGMIGLGRMGANMVRRLQRNGQSCVAYDRNPEAVAAVVAEGAAGAASLVEFIAQLAAPRNVWIMVPAAFVDSTIAELVPLLSSGDTIIDGGNSYYRDDLRRSAELRNHGLHYLDVGTSGGVFGLERGYCLMIGGDTDAVRRMEPVFEVLAPGFDTATRTPTRSGPVTPAEQGWLHCGPSGSGHFVKMVHNGIEYGLMAAYAEGFAILEKANIGKQTQEHDAETTPLRDPEAYQYDIDTAAVAELWRRGSVVSSWLLDLTANALSDDPSLGGFGGNVSDSGEGRWTMLAAIDEGVPANVLATALFERFSSRNEGEYSNKLLSAMRKQFGGHVEKK